MIVSIERTNELRFGVEYRMIQLDQDETPEQVAGGREAFLFASKIINARYLFIEVGKEGE